MNVVIKNTKNGFVGLNEKGEILSLMSWSVEEKQPKEGEIWSCSHRLYQPLILRLKIEEGVEIRHPYQTDKFRLQNIRKRFDTIFKMGEIKG